MGSEMCIRDSNSTSRRLNSCLLIDNTATAHLPGPQNPGECHLYFAEGCHLYIALTRDSPTYLVMVTDTTGELADAISLHNKASKGRAGGRTIPLHRELADALLALKTVRGERVRPDCPVIYSERAPGHSPNAVAIWFHTRYREIGLEGASSHSGRRTFITAIAKKITEAGGSLRDVQEMAGHSSLSMTQRYIQGDSTAKRNVIELI